MIGKDPICSLQLHIGPETRQRQKTTDPLTRIQHLQTVFHEQGTLNILKQSTNLEVHSNGNSTACSLYTVATFSTPKGSDPPTPVGPDRWQSHWVVFCLISSTSCMKAAIRWAKKESPENTRFVWDVFWRGEKTYPVISLDAPPPPSNQSLPNEFSEAAVDPTSMTTVYLAAGWHRSGMYFCLGGYIPPPFARTQDIKLTGLPWLP